MNGFGVYKIIAGMEKADREVFSSSQKLFGRFRIVRRKHFFTHCIINWWNSLPQDAMRVTNPNGSKKELNVNSWRIDLSKTIALKNSMLLLSWRYICRRRMGGKHLSHISCLEPL